MDVDAFVEAQSLELLLEYKAMNKNLIATLLLFGFWPCLSMANSPGEPVSVGSAIQSHDAISERSNLLKGREKLRSDPESALGRRLIHLEALTTRSIESETSQNDGGPTKIGFNRSLAALKTQEETRIQLDWKPAAGGMVGQIAINSPRAVALRLGLRIESLPESAQLRFFTSGATEVQLVDGRSINSLITKNLAAGDPEETALVYWSPIMQGEIIGLEIYIPEGVSPGEVLISAPKVSHLFTLPTSQSQVTPLASSSCNVNVICNSAWLSASNAVARMSYTTSSGSFLCTGTLLNDVQATHTPYFLTANHCISTQSSASTLQTYWFYRSTQCATNVQDPGMIVLGGGATLLANTPATDASFMRLNGTPPSGVVFSGWTTNVPAVNQAITGLHNPAGDLQKISQGTVSSYYICSPEAGNCSSSDVSSGTYVGVRFASGIVEGGSSGSALFLDAGQAISGQLYGKETNLSCDNPDALAFYGRFDKTYEIGGLGQWLDSAPETYILTIARLGFGTVTSAPSGINCGTTCNASFSSGTSVVLTATPSAGYEFSGWSGACSSTGSCTVVMDSAKNVTATFTAIGPPPVTYVLTVDKSGSGTVTSSPAGINCGSTCSASFSGDSSVVLTASPLAGYVFAGWSGACSGTASCTVVMDSSKNVVAEFVPGFRLTTSRIGSGTVTSSPAGINCGTTCSASFSSGTRVVLTASPARGYVFAGWSGACSGTDPCTVVMDSAKSVTATFTLIAPPPNAYVLTVNKSGSGTVTSSPAGINCGATCSASFSDGSSVVLTASPSAGYEFAGWSGACLGADPCTVVMDSAKSATATFTPIAPPPITYVLTVDKSGSGTVTSMPAGINCGTTCSATFSGGTSIVLTASASPGHVFVGWSGACSGTASCTVAMDSSKNVLAQFVPAFRLNTSKEGSGMVTSTPAGINCGEVCLGSFQQGSSVSLLATPDSGYAFSNWRGACAGVIGSECTLKLDADLSASVEFVDVNLPQYRLRIERSPNGVVTSSTPGIECGGTKKACMANFSVVSVTAVPNNGYYFKKWIGCLDVDGPVCWMKMAAPVKIKPVFAPIPKYKLKVNKNRLGSVTSDVGFTCKPNATSCSRKFYTGTTLTLSAEPLPGRTFVGWAGACSGTDSCTLTIDGPKGVSATFQ